MRAKRGVSVPDEVTKIVSNLPKRRAILRLELMILKKLRITYLMTVKPLADEY
jgi:hypothetical protein